MNRGLRGCDCRVKVTLRDLIAYCGSASFPLVALAKFKLKLWSHLSCTIIVHRHYLHTHLSFLAFPTFNFALVFTFLYELYR
ncbi:hypothetical protein M426DRAFT_241763 [Hypoxylon sp. CI-4A]|nr:hypothetical protein M426DRAFT_241763 [Hypoxylon sp. CI-4A]